MKQALTTNQVEAVFRRIFNGGEMRRLPKSRKDTEVVLALAASALDPREVYSEKGVNEVLAEWMTGFTDAVTMDHVTIRRYLVDGFFLLRDTGGTTYRTTQVIINQVIEPEARSIQPNLILEAVNRERAQRKRNAP